MRQLQSRGAIPAVCYDSCSKSNMELNSDHADRCFLDNANLEAQAIGKNPELCDPDGTFFTYYNACQGCLKNADNTQAQDYLDPAFSQFIDYCNALSSTPVTSTPAASASHSSAETHITLTAVTVLITIPYTATVDGVQTVWPLTKTLTSFAPLPDLTVLSVTTWEDGHSTIWTFLKTLTSLANDPVATVSSNTTLPTAPQTTSQVPKCKWIVRRTRKVSD